jgi:hypothetical protein
MAPCGCEERAVANNFGTRHFLIRGGELPFLRHFVSANYETTWQIALF